MVSRTVKLALAIVFSLPAVQADLKLSPQTEQFDLDGLKMQRLVFVDGAERITYAPPPGWSYSGNAGMLTLRPPTTGGGEATVTRIALPTPETFDEETTKKLVERAIASLPSGAVNVSVVSQEKNPLLIERKETFLVVIKYDFYGETLQRSVMFLNRQNEQVRFQLTAPVSRFPELQRAFQSSHYSWQHL